MFYEVPKSNIEPPPPRKCDAERCNNQALSNSRWCADCDDQVRALWPNVWFQRRGVFEDTQK